VSQTVLRLQVSRQGVRDTVEHPLRRPVVQCPLSDLCHAVPVETGLNRRIQQGRQVGARNGRRCIGYSLHAP
jgi:hypothetical protein